ncbi:hypothetical protein LINGRAHAP2_LOCUS4432, partial [Linum grandiflorum]
FHTRKFRRGEHERSRILQFQAGQINILVVSYRCKLLQQRFQISVRRSTFFISIYGLFLEHDSSLSHFFRMVTSHYLPNCSLNVFPTHHDLPLTPRPFLRTNTNPDPQNIRHQLLVQELLCLERPCHHWHTTGHTFQCRVPSTVSHEPACRFVIKYQHLWCPSPYNQPFPFHPFLKPFRQPFLAILFRSLFHHPNEALPRRLKRCSNLQQLSIRKTGYAPKADVENRTRNSTV